MSAPNPGKPERIGIAQRRQLALELRKGGASYRQIGEQLGTTHATAFRDVMACLAELAEKRLEETQRLRALELARLDDLLLALHTKAKNGNLGAVDRVLKVIELRARLTGLLTPTGRAKGEAADDGLPHDLTPEQARRELVAIFTAAAAETGEGAAAPGEDADGPGGGAPGAGGNRTH